MERSKTLFQDDISAFDFVKECLKGDATSAINFDRIQFDYLKSQYVIIEYLFCEEMQSIKGITPYSSHPNRYFFKNSKKFTALWDLTIKLGARLYLVNYAKKSSTHSSEVLVMKVINIDQKNKLNPVHTKNYNVSRDEFSIWLRKLNQKGFKKP